MKARIPFKIDIHVYFSFEKRVYLRLPLFHLFQHLPHTLICNEKYLDVELRNVEEMVIVSENE